MPRLTDDVKTFIVQQLAMFERPSDVADAVKVEFGLNIDRQHVRIYNPEQVSVAKKWKALFDATRDEFLSEKAKTGIAHRAVRMRIREQIVYDARRMKNYRVVGEMLEQAAKEMGDAYTNRQKLEHLDSNGNPFQAGVTVVIEREDGKPSEVRRIA